MVAAIILPKKGQTTKHFDDFNDCKLCHLLYTQDEAGKKSARCPLVIIFCAII